MMDVRRGVAISSRRAMPGIGATLSRTFCLRRRIDEFFPSHHSRYNHIFIAISQLLHLHLAFANLLPKATLLRVVVATFLSAIPTWLSSWLQGEASFTVAFAPATGPSASCDP